MATGKLEDNPILRYQAQQAITERDTTLGMIELNRTHDQQSGLTEEKLTAVRNKGQADDMVQTAMSGFAAKTTAANDIASGILGLDHEKSNYRLAKLSAEREEAYESTKISSAEIARKQGMTIMSDPLGFISAQFTLPADIAAHNYYVDRYDAASGEFANIVSSGSAVAAANKALQATTSTSMAEGQLKAIRAQTENALVETKLEGLKLHTAGLLQLQGMNESMLRNAASAVSIDETIKNNELRRAQMALSMEQSMALRAERLAKANSVAAVQAEEDNLVKHYNLAAVANNSPPLPKSMLLSKFRRNDEGAVLIRKMIGIGEDIELNGDKGKTGVPIAINAAEAAKLHIDINARPTGTDASTIIFLAKTYNAAMADPIMGAQKDIGARNTQINTVIKMKADNEMKAIRDDTPNIYAAPPLQALLTATPALANYPFITKTIGDIVTANPTIPLKTADIVAAAKVAVGRDVNKIDEISKAASLYFASAINYNNSMKGFSENAVPPQKGYNAVLSEGFLGRDQTLDLSLPINFKSMLMKSMFQASYVQY